MSNVAGSNPPIEAAADALAAQAASSCAARATLTGWTSPVLHRAVIRAAALKKGRLAAIATDPPLPNFTDVVTAGAYTAPCLCGLTDVYGDECRWWYIQHSAEALDYLHVMATPVFSVNSGPQHACLQAVSGCSELAVRLNAHVAQSPNSIMQQGLVDRLCTPDDLQLRNDQNGTTGG
ncbi:hypothetical protein ABBQ38_010278 [Trebouxia sp. C0009 RCD-2024]